VKTERNYKNISAIVLAILALTAIPSIYHPAHAATSSTGVIVPLYGYPGSSWTGLIRDHEAYPTVPVVAVVNPASGPGWGVDSNFLSGIKSLQSAGISVLGYVASGYTGVALSSAEAQVQDYVSWYGVNGVYVDQMSNVAGSEWYYSDLTSYAHSIGADFVVGNPGADVPSSYVGTVDSIVIYENAGLPSLSFLAGWHTSYSKANFGIVSYDDSFDASFIQSASSYLGWIFTTDGTWPNPYASLPSYMDSLLSTLSTATPAPVPAATLVSPTQGAGSISVVTDVKGGGEIYGMYTTLWSNGALVTSCFSPCSFPVSGGHTYSVAVSNYGSYYFSEWGDGTLSQFFTVSEPASPTQLTLWAFYN
jgi:hypothetical protein